jgi:plastocyanin
MQRIIAVIFVAALASCGGGSTGPDAGPTTQPGGSQNPGGTPASNTITVSNNNFSPDNLQTTVNSTVTWKWDSCAGDGYGGTSCTEHTVTFSDGTTSNAQSSGTFTRRFTAAGTYSYKCSIHGGYMTGVVVVK